MRRTILKFFLPIGAAALIAGCGADIPETVPVTSGTADTPAVSVQEDGYILRSDLLKCLYYDERDSNIYDQRSCVYETDGELLCGVAPHHLAAGHFIAGLYRTAAESRSDIGTVVLAAPMHYKSANTLCTSARSWDTAYGVLENDAEITALFHDSLGAAYDDDMTGYDHSASSHIPFIKRYLPDAKISVLLVSPDAGSDFPEKLAELLYEVSQTKKCLFAFSIDFSHYLQPEQAEKHDAETLRAVTSGDTAAIGRFTDDNVDTPYCLGAFVRLSELMGRQITAADHGNTYTVGSAPYDPTQFSEGVTSYFVFLS